jgi:hypothetical protein
MGRFGTNEGDEDDGNEPNDRPLRRYRESTTPRHRERIKTRDDHTHTETENKSARRNVREKDRDDDDPAGTTTHYEESRITPQTLIKQFALDHPTMSVQQIAKRVGKLSGLNVSTLTVSNIMREFKHSIKVLTERGLIKQKKS